MHDLQTSGTHPRAHSNIVCGCPHCKKFDYADTVITSRRQVKPSIDDTIPSARPRPPITMQIDDCTRLLTIDTETLEHIVQYVADDETVVMTQTVDPHTWALYESPFARRRPPLRKQK